MLPEYSQDLWTYLANDGRPIVLYGMGNGADKIIAELERRGLHAADVFASDGFVRGQSFHGLTVTSYGQVRGKYGDGNFIILLSFATTRPEVLQRIVSISRENELLAPDVPPYGDTLFDLPYYLSVKERLSAVRERYYDEESKRIFDAVVSFRLTGRIGELLDACSDPYETFLSVLHPNTYRTAVDLGAYCGDSILSLLPFAPALERVIALEPDPHSYKKLCALGEKLARPVVKAYPYAAYSGPCDLSLSATGGRGSAVGTGAKAKTVRADSLDRLEPDCKPDYIKFDVEGSEAQALLGCRGAIGRARPEILLSLYHRSEDLFALPELADSVYPDTRFYLRRPGGIPAWDLNLLIVPESR